MPAVRLSRRRKSSHAAFTPAKPGTYGVNAKPVTFAPNVTPGTFVEPDPADDPANPLAVLAATAADPAAGPNVKALFPDQSVSTSQSTRKRCPPGKRFSQGYIPRPPNAFMLFRADFVKQKHVPGTIEANHSSLSKIIGNYWRSLPPEEKRAWEVKAKHEKAAHKIRFPDYRFRPVHNKNKLKSAIPSSKDDQTLRGKALITAEEERRCEEVAQLLLEGKKGDELAKAVQSLDRARSRERELELEFEMEMGMGFEDDSFEGTSSGAGGSLQPSRAASPGGVGLMPTLHMPTAVHSNGLGFGMAQNSFGMDISLQRRPSSVPLPNEWFANQNNSFMGSGAVAGGIALPSLPSFVSHPPSPIASISRFNQAQGQVQFNNPFFTSESQPFSTAEASHQGQGIFQPQPQPFSSNSRASFGLGLRRASSAQPLLWRSWTTPMSNFDNFNMDMGMNHQMPIERDPSPLPEVDPGLFGNFSFPSVGPSHHGQSGGSHSASPITLPPILAPIDTAIPPMQNELSASTATTSGTTPTSSISPSPVSSMLNLDSEVLNHGFTDMHLDGLYPHNGASDMGSGIDIYSHDAVNGVYDMGMGGMYSYEPIVVSPSHHVGGEDDMLSPKPTPTPTQSEFAQQQDAF
ncbi:hypothetical protein CVT26_014483 [Gymnopilus dilepis]|uniref:HMG box domain-containing protein n=1 Tax=Gymnopilus dilepis TaxID=231916 RepID=A0A409X1W1_9AGAR|nr:hypothetical protein CVT26_014483 [Gymnopilus dilepis]